MGAAAQVPNEKLGNSKNSRRRRKKRRTEDFSSDSDSSSSSSSSPSDVEETSETKEISTVNIDDIDIVSDNEEKFIDPQNPRNDFNQLISNETREQINRINFTKKIDEDKNSEQEKTSIKKAREQLDQEFLGLMASTYSDDLDELRKKPDFTDKSLIMLAKTLQSSSNIFDRDSLEALLEN